MSSSFNWLLIAATLWGVACRNANGTPSADVHAGHRAVEPTHPVAGPRPSVGVTVAARRASHAERGGSDHGGHESRAGHDGEKDDALPGYVAFTLDRARATAVGLQLAPVALRSFQRTLRTTGFVVLDETRTSHVHSKVRGWIDKVQIDFVGKRVTSGTTLCTIYSQEVLAAQLEFLSVLEQAAGPALPGALGDAEAQARSRLIEAGRRRLGLWDVPEREIARLESTRTPQRTFTLTAPRTGIVVTRQALPGMFIDPSVELYVVSDVSRLWMLADVYESDAPWVRPGTNATLQFEGASAEKREAKVSFVPPTVDEATRTLKVRFDLDNADGKLRPGTFATIELELDLGRALALPEESVIHLGPRSVVFVVAGERVEPRAIQLGPLVDGYYRVDGGLQAGDSVAVGAQFLIDSESRLRATAGQGPSHVGH